VDEDDTLDVAAPGVLDTDANGDPLTAGVADDAQHGTLTPDPDGSFTYAPDGTFHGTDSFTSTADDGTEDSADTAKVSIGVGAVNDDPVAEDDAAVVSEYDSNIVYVLRNDTDNDGQGDLRTALVRTLGDPRNGAATASLDGTITYAPGGDFHGIDSFTHEVCDAGDPAVCDSATVTMTVTPVPDARTIDGTGKNDVICGARTGAT
jgi:VCBS repeat-containing protein